MIAKVGHWNDDEVKRQDRATVWKTESQAEQE